MSFIISDHYSEWLLLILFLVTVLIIIFMYSAIRKKYYSETQGFLRQIVEDINKMYGGEKLQKPTSGKFLEETGELYDNIEKLNESLKAQYSSKDNMISIINSFALNIELEEILNDMLPKIIDGTRSNWGAIYLNNPQTEKFELKSAVGFSKNIYTAFDTSIGEGFVGKSGLSDKIEVFNDIPDDTIYISRTFLGKIKPKAVMTVPIMSQGKNIAVMLLASIYSYEEEQKEIVKMVRYYLGSAITNGLTYERTKRLKNELLFQNQLIQNMNEELEHKVEGRSKFLNSVLNSVVDYAIITMDADGYIIVWNKGAEAIRGFSEDEVLGKHISETYFGEEKDAPVKRLEIAKDRGRYEEQSWITRRDGSVIFANLIISAIYDDSDKLVGFTNVVRDITPKKTLENKVWYLNTLSEILLADESKGLLIINDEGIVTDTSLKAAEICNLSTLELDGVLFEGFLANSERFRHELNKCISELTTEDWTDKLLIEGNETDISLSLTGMVISGSNEKIAVLYIENI